MISVGCFENSVDTCSFILVEANDVISEIAGSVPVSLVIFEVDCAAVMDTSMFCVENIVVFVGFSEDCSVP